MNWSAPRSTDERSNLIHREILQLAALIVVAVAAFFVTRAIAANNRDMNLRDAAEWYQQGVRALDAGDSTSAIAAFRRATIRNRANRQYALALARALAYQRQDDAARSALLALRESAPEDPEINLELARIAANQSDASQAIRYYRNALYAAWPVDQADARRRVRIELIEFLIRHDRTANAQSELVALGAELPNEAAGHLEIGRLFATVGDNRRALEQFQQGLRIAPGDGAALAGAGSAAFQLADYAAVQRYLRHAPDSISGVRETRDLVDLILSNDPLAARVGPAARRHRLIEVLNYADQRVAECIAQRSSPALPADDALRSEVGALRTRLKLSASLDQDTIESGVEFAYRLARRAVQLCAAPTLRDRALIRIGQRHGMDQP